MVHQGGGLDTAYRAYKRCRPKFERPASFGGEIWRIIGIGIRGGDQILKDPGPAPPWQLKSSW